MVTAAALFILVRVLSCEVNCETALSCIFSNDKGGCSINKTAIHRTCTSNFTYHQGRTGPARTGAPLPKWWILRRGCMICHDYCSYVIWSYGYMVLRFLQQVVQLMELMGWEGESKNVGDMWDLWVDWADTCLLYWFPILIDFWKLNISFSGLTWFSIISLFIMQNSHNCELKPLLCKFCLVWLTFDMICRKWLTHNFDKINFKKILV